MEPGIKAPYFKRLSIRKEESGNTRVYVSDSTMPPLFEIFIWKDKDNQELIRFDLHYNNQHEVQVAWKEGKDHLTGTEVFPEKEKDFGMKKTQVMGESVTIEDAEVVQEFIVRLQETKSRDTDPATLADLSVIEEKLTKLPLH